MSKAKRRRKLGYETPDPLSTDILFRMGNAWTIRSTAQLEAMVALGATSASEFIRVAVAYLPLSLQEAADELADDEGSVWVHVRPE